MFITLLAMSIVWIGIFIASAAFDVYFEVYRPRFLTDNPVGRFFTALFIAPLILTIAITALVALVPCFVMDLLDPKPNGERYSACDECWDTIDACCDWFFDWAPAFVTSGKE